MRRAGRLTTRGPALHVLLALGPDTKHGYAIMQEIAEGSGGRVRVLPGTLYATIKRLLADGLIEECDPPSQTDSRDVRRRYYRVSRAGRIVAREETQRLVVLLKLGRAFLR
jgi:DNA-binding PadR family transcriptional regulator